MKEKTNTRVPTYVIHKNSCFYIFFFYYLLYKNDENEDLNNK